MEWMSRRTRRDRRWAIWFCLVLAAVPASAFETDQYLAASADLADAAPVINEFINHNAELVLERVNHRGGRVACEELPPKIYRRLFRNMLSSRLRRFVKTSERIDRFPGDHVSGFQYNRQSIYRRPSFPFVVPLSRTIRVGDVHFGIDKFGHIFGFGRRYYGRYHRHLRNGMNEEEALRKVVGWGMMMERYFVGGIADGVFSYADLEANYQGLELARSFCEGPRPHLERRDGSWMLARPIELERYVNHDFDESVNNNHYVGHRWRQVRPMLVGRYCEPFERGEIVPDVRPRSASFSARLVAERFASKGRQRQRLHSLVAVCGAARQTAELAAR